VRLAANFDAAVFDLATAFPKVPLPPRSYKRAFGSAPAGQEVRIRFGEGARPKPRRDLAWTFAYAVDGALAGYRVAADLFLDGRRVGGGGGDIGNRWATYTAGYPADEVRVKVTSGDPRGTLLLAGVGYV
jgi:hypothetical protein